MVNEPSVFGSLKFLPYIRTVSRFLRRPDTRGRFSVILYTVDNFDNLLFFYLFFFLFFFFTSCLKKLNNNRGILNEE